MEEEKSSSFADEGTLAHAICATKLKSWLKQDTSEEEREIAQYAKYHTSEMEDYTDTYVSIVLEKYSAALKKTKDAKLLIETRLDFTEYVPESFGTGDAVIIADGTMEVIDFKYGKGVRVEAKENADDDLRARSPVEVLVRLPHRGCEDDHRAAPHRQPERV